MEGRRERMREKVKQVGLDALADHELLEYMLYPFIPRKDVNPLAHTLLKAFGSLQGVLTANESELKKYPPMTNTAAQYLSVLPEMVKRAEKQRLNQDNNFLSLDTIVLFMQNSLKTEVREQLVLLALDSKARLLRSKVIDSNFTDKITFDIREFVEFAVASRAYSMVVGHNHPRSSAYPSENDIVATLDIMTALNAVRIDFADHIIIGNGNYFSFRAEGLATYNDLVSVSAVEIANNCKLHHLNEVRRLYIND